MTRLRRRVDSVSMAVNISSFGAWLHTVGACLMCGTLSGWAIRSTLAGCQFGYTAPATVPGHQGRLFRAMAYDGRVADVAADDTAITRERHRGGPVIDEHFLHRNAVAAGTFHRALVSVDRRGDRFGETIIRSKQVRLFRSCEAAWFGMLGLQLSLDGSPLDTPLAPGGS